MPNIVQNQAYSNYEARREIRQIVEEITSIDVIIGLLESRQSENQFEADEDQEESRVLRNEKDQLLEKLTLRN